MILRSSRIFRTWGWRPTAGPGTTTSGAIPTASRLVMPGRAWDGNGDGFCGDFEKKPGLFVLVKLVIPLISAALVSFCERYKCDLLGSCDPSRDSTSFYLLFCPFHLKKGEFSGVWALDHLDLCPSGVVDLLMHMIGA